MRRFGLRRRWRGRAQFLLILSVLVAAGLAVPERITLPVAGATPADWHPDSFWFSPWGESGVHKGIDIFADRGTRAVAATTGLIVYAGHQRLGGNTVLLSGAKWRQHYYAHLDSLTVEEGDWVWRGDTIGYVGDSGNAKGKPPHLHYAIVTAIPYPWLMTREPQGWRKAIYLNPDQKLRMLYDW